MNDINDFEMLARVTHQVYTVLDDIAFRTGSGENDDYLVFTGIEFKCKFNGRLFGVDVNADMSRIKIEELDESEEVPF